MNELTTTENKVVRTPFAIATEINAIKEQTRKIVLINAIEIGRRLVEAKEVVAHGEWENWLQESVDFSTRTAQNLMKLFDEYGTDQTALFGNNVKTQALADLSYTQAVLLLAVPAEEREEFIEENDVPHMTTRELEQAIKERDEALKKLGNAMTIANEKSEEARQLLEAKQSVESEVRLTDRVLRETQETVKQLQEALQKEKEDAKAEVDRLCKALEGAKATGNTDQITKLEGEVAAADAALKSAEKEIAELKRQLNEKPIEVSAETVVENVPEDVEKELAELREKVKSGAQVNPTEVKFRVCFDSLVKGFHELLGTLAEIKESVPEAHDKYKNAVLGLIGKMEERL